MELLEDVLERLDPILVANAKQYRHAGNLHAELDLLEEALKNADGNLPIMARALVQRMR